MPHDYTSSRRVNENHINTIELKYLSDLSLSQLRTLLDKRFRTPPAPLGSIEERVLDRSQLLRAVDAGHVAIKQEDEEAEKKTQLQPSTMYSPSERIAISRPPRQQVSMQMPALLPAHPAQSDTMINHVQQPVPKAKMVSTEPLLPGQKPASMQTPHPVADIFHCSSNGLMAGPMPSLSQTIQACQALQQQIHAGDLVMKSEDDGIEWLKLISDSDSESNCDDEGPLSAASYASSPFSYTGGKPNSSATSKTPTSSSLSSSFSSQQHACEPTPSALAPRQLGPPPATQHVPGAASDYLASSLTAPLHKVVVEVQGGNYNKALIAAAEVCGMIADWRVMAAQ